MPLLRNQYGSLTIKRLRVSAIVRKDVSDETVRFILRGASYRFLHSKKMGLLKRNDLQNRRKFPCKVTKMLTDKFWEEVILF